MTEHLVRKLCGIYNVAKEDSWEGSASLRKPGRKRSRSEKKSAQESIAVISYE
jgi:hypothetical protein